MIKSTIKITKKNITILIITLLILFQSTNVGSEENYFQIKNFEIQEKIEINFSREKIIEESLKKTFNQLLKQILLSKDIGYIKKVKLADIKSFIKSFELYEESFAGNEYSAKFNIYFDKDKIGLFLAKNNLVFSAPKNVSLMFFPIILDKGKIFLFEDNIIYQNFSEYAQKEKNIINYIIPISEIDELQRIIKNKNEIENFDFKYLAEKYNVENYTITIINLKNKKSTVLLKTYFGKKKFVKTVDYNFSDLKNQSNLLSITSDIRKNILDNWKGINSINLYQPVIINFKFVHQNIKELNNLEQALEKINIITEYSILEHDKENTTFKIAYLGNPKRLSQELLDLDYELVDMQGSWAIKKK